LVAHRWKFKDSETGGHSMTDEVLSDSMRVFHEQDVDGNVNTHAI